MTIALPYDNIVHCVALWCIVYKELEGLRAIVCVLLCEPAQHLGSMRKRQKLGSRVEGLERPM